VLVLGDIHGGVDSVRKVVTEVKRTDLAAVLCTGDFASISIADAVQDLELVAKVFEYLASLGVDVVYTWGNRDLLLFERVIKLGSVEQRKRARELIEYMLSFSNVYEAPNRDRLCLKSLGLCITSNPQLIDSKTILLTHYVSEAYEDAFLHIEGHVHYGQIHGRYINAGFVYRDDMHGAKPMEGMYMVIDIEGTELRGLEVKLLSDDLKFYSCPHHPDEGLFIIPKWWRKCPVCYDISRAKFTKQVLSVDNLFQGAL